MRKNLLKLIAILAVIAVAMTSLPFGVFAEEATATAPEVKIYIK